MTVRGNNQELAVRSPLRARWAPFVAAIGEIAVRDLSGRAAVRADDEHLHVARLEIPYAVETIDQAVIRGRRIGPFRSGRRTGQVRQVWTLARNEG